MQPFNLEEWLQDKSRKVVTRDGRPVRIVCWDAKMEYPIVALVLNKSNNKELALHYRVDGTYSPLMESDVDLFFANEEKTNKILDELKSYLKNTPKEKVEKDWKEIQDWYNQHCADESNNEEQLTEFEQGIKTWMSEFLLGTEQSVPNEIVKKATQKVLDLARKELDLVDNTCGEYALNEAYKQAKQDALKDFPKWKKAKEDRVLEGLAVKFNKDGKIIFSDIVHKGEYFIILQSLETLPKEE